MCFAIPALLQQISIFLRKREKGEGRQAHLSLQWEISGSALRFSLFNIQDQKTEYDKNNPRLPESNLQRLRKYARTWKPS